MTLREIYIKDITTTAVLLLRSKPLVGSGLGYDLSADAAFIVAALIVTSARLPLDTEVPDDEMTELNFTELWEEIVQCPLCGCSCGCHKNLDIPPCYDCDCYFRCEEFDD